MLPPGYDLTLINDAHTTTTIELDTGARIEAADVIQELNVVMTWLSYPGRTTSTATAEEVVFATPATPETTFAAVPSTETSRHYAP